MRYLYILNTILFTVYGQLILKWRISQAGPLPTPIIDKLLFLLHQFSDIWILTAFAASIIAALSWMAAMTKFELSHAYPFMSLSFVLVLVFSTVFLHEKVTAFRALGMVLIISGLVVGNLQ